jgi:hypothetical protein
MAISAYLFLFGLGTGESRTIGDAINIALEQLGLL